MKSKALFIILVGMALISGAFAISFIIPSQTVIIPNNDYEPFDELPIDLNPIGTPAAREYLIQP